MLHNVFIYYSVISFDFKFRQNSNKNRTISVMTSLFKQKIILFGEVQLKRNIWFMLIVLTMKLE